MKKSYILIAVAMVAALLMTGCKNNNKKSQEPTQEEIQAQKQALADSVLAKIDALTDDYIIASKNGLIIRSLELTEAEKMVKPDYLLDPAEANKFVAKSQKINALAIYLIERELRIIYDVSVDEVNDAIVRLTADLNYPLDYDIQNIKDKPISERLKAEYDKCKENGDLTQFWQFNSAIMYEFDYIIAQNTDLIFSRITEEQWQGYKNKKLYRRAGIKELAKYDEEMATLYSFIESVQICPTDEQRQQLGATKESAKQWYIANKDKIIARRGALLR